MMQDSGLWLGMDFIKFHINFYAAGSMPEDGSSRSMI
jgi:hypothetical protein